MKKKHFGYSPTTDIHSPLWIVPLRGFGGFQPPQKNNRFSQNLQQMKNYFLAFTLAATISATAQHKTLAGFAYGNPAAPTGDAVSYTHLRAHETSLHLVCRLLLEKKA